MPNSLYSNGSAHAALECVLSTATRSVTTLLLVLLICSVGVCPGCSSGSAQAEAADDQPASPSVTCIERLGLSGAITSGGVLLGRLTENGPEVIFLATDDGLYAISNGELQWWQSGVHSPALIDDITGDGARDLVVSRGSSICGHNGVTGEKVWQATPKQRVFEKDLGWSDWGFSAGDLQILRADESQIVAVTSGRCLFGVSSQDGDLRWEFEGPDRLLSMAVVSDQDEDGTDEVVVGTETGFIYVISGDTGKVKWKEKVGEQWLEQGTVRYGSVVSIASVDTQGSRVVIGTVGGRVCLVDAQAKDLVWEYRVFAREDSRGGPRIWLMPDVTGDGLPEILADKGYVSEAVEPSTTTPVGVRVTSMPLKIVVLLSGADGSEVWTAEMYVTGLSVAFVDGQPMLLEPHPQLGIRTVSLKDGSVIDSLKIATLDGKTPQARQLTDGSYLTFSNGSDLAVISADGAVQWYYPRVDNSVVMKGNFTSDAIPDLLGYGESAQSADKGTGTRLVSVVNGATHKEIWRYEVPWADFATSGGLSGVQVAGDLTGDGIQDAVACRGSTVFRFSGDDGSLARFDVDADVVSLEPVKVGTNTNAILVGSGDGLVILDKECNRLWESAYTDWSDAEVGAVRVLNDLDQDGTSDLAILFADRILVAKSGGTGPLDFETHRSFTAGDNRTIEFRDLTNDIDGDGVQEIAYLEYDQDKSEASGVLLVVSPVSGKVWHQWNMPVTVDLASADFNGDHCLDSLVHRQEPKPQYSTQDPYYGQNYSPTKLEVYSGKDNSILWAHSFEEDRWNADDEKMPAAPVGDITGDGIEDLAVSCVTALAPGGSFVTVGTAESRFLHETRVSVYDIANRTLVREVALPPVQKDSDVVWDESHVRDFEPVSGPGDAMRLAGDLNRDGHRELAVLAGYLPLGGHCLALVDLHNEHLLGYSTLLNTLDFFEANEDYTLGFTTEGSVYLARVSSELKVMSPADGSTVGSRARIAWEGMGDSSSVSVFVDGYENARTNANEVTLLLTPGEHEVAIRSVDGFGTVTYAAVEFKVREFPWVSILAAMSVVALLVLYFSARGIRVIANRRAQREEL